MRFSRFRNPFMPVQPTSVGRAEHLVISLEKWLKGVLFNCSMCGNCLLQETAFICPLLCPKGLRNGPCGSGSAEQCCLDPARPCIWHQIYMRADRLGRVDRLLEEQAPLDWSRVGRETWVSFISGALERGLVSPVRVVGDQDWRSHVDDLFHDLRQSDWRQGDDRYHSTAAPNSASQLQSALERGEFVVTAEIAPPIAASATKLQEKAALLSGLIYAANVTENAMSTPRMSSLAFCLLLAQFGIEPILQIIARDYNRFALQSETLIASVLGIHNVLCLTGDPPNASGGPSGGLPFDLDATQILWILRRLRDEARFLDGRLVSTPPQLFLGSAASHNDPSPTHEALRVEKKINAGAQYLQTQLVYDVDLLQRWLEVLDKRCLLDKVNILVGIGPLPSTKVARYIQVHVPDIVIPDHFIEKMERSTEPEKVGLEFASELIGKIKALPGVSGVHIMTFGRMSVLPRLLRDAGLIEQSNFARFLLPQIISLSSPASGYLKKVSAEAKMFGDMLKVELCFVRHMTFVTSKIAWRESRKMAHDKTHSIEYDRLSPRLARRSLCQPKNVFCGLLAPVS